jgi:hypothetical protein
MTVPPLDPFSQSFDAIEVDPTRAPPREAIEHAMAYVAPQTPSEPPAPGFYLLNDANGRFVIDRDMGVVTLADDSILQTERNSVHAARLRVVEPSGATYELDMQLRITGRVPQMLGAEEFAAIAGLTDETILVAPRVPLLIVAQEAPKAPVEVTPTAWTRFAVAQGHQSRTPRQQPRRSFIVADLPQSSERISFEFDGLPRPFSAHLPWSL